MNALRHAAGQGQIALSQPQHLRALDDARVAGGAGRADGVVRARDAHVQRSLAGRVVGHGAGIVVVRPELRVVVEAFEFVDFIFRFDVAMLSHADVDADHRLIDVRPIQPGVEHGFVGTVNPHAARTGAAANFFAFLVAQLVEIAHAGQRRPHIANLVVPHAALAGQNRCTEVFEVIAVRRRQPDAGNHHALRIGQSCDHAIVKVSGRGPIIEITGSGSGWQGADGACQAKPQAFGALPLCS